MFLDNTVPNLFFIYCTNLFAATCLQTKISNLHGTYRSESVRRVCRRESSFDEAGTNRYDVPVTHYPKITVFMFNGNQT